MIGDLSKHKILKGLKNPGKSINYLLLSNIKRLRLMMRGEYITPSSSKVIDEEWDYLVILDACRLDSFLSHNPFDDEPETKISQAPCTRPWFVKNFGDPPKNKTNDIVYVSANPQASSRTIDKSELRHIEEVFEYEFDGKIIHTVPPEKVTDKALQMVNDFPKSRIVVHYIQPHGPFYNSDSPDLHLKDYKKLREGEVSQEEVLEAYNKSLESVLKEVERFVEYANGKVVITSDHGESLGENGIYAHPSWGYTETLLKVPWLEIEAEGDKKIDEAVLEDSTKDKSDVSIKEQLEHLGYR